MSTEPSGNEFQIANPWSNPTTTEGPDARLAGNGVLLIPLAILSALIGAVFYLKSTIDASRVKTQTPAEAVSQGNS